MGGLRVPESENLFVSQGDIKDYFYACGIDEGLSEYFCLPPSRPTSFFPLGFMKRWAKPSVKVLTIRSLQ